MHASTRHVLAACCLPGRNFPVLKDSYDNEEHGVSQELLEILEESCMNNRAVFVVQYYDGTHIGSARIEAILEAARNALLVKPFNDITGSHQYPMTREEIISKKQSFRPKRNIDRKSVRKRRDELFVGAEWADVAENPESVEPSTDTEDK